MSVLGTNVWACATDTQFERIAARMTGAKRIGRDIVAPGREFGKREV
jgi:hypothetical protein